MIINRSKNAIFNIISGIINKVINIILPFFVRTIMINTLGADYLGLNNLFISILQIINLAELGISSAIVFSMYKPIAEDDKDTICALMNMYKKIYKIIGIIVIFIGIALIPFLKYFINGEYPSNINIYVLYIIYLFNTGISYFVFSYKSALLNAHQKNGVISNINSIISIFQNLIQMILLYVFKNYYLYIIVTPIFTVLSNIRISFLVDKMYPNYKCKGKISKEISKDISMRVKGLMITRICNTTRNAFDSIFISSMIGLTSVAIYSNYYYIIAAIFSILTIITNSMTAGVGNSIALESVEKNYQDMRKFNFIYSWISGICTVCLLCLYQPFMKIWVGESMMYSMNIVIAFCMYFYALTLGGIRAIYHDACGLWWEARYRAIIESVMNLILNYILTLKLGVLGTIIGTLISLIVVNYGYGTQIIFKNYFKEFKVRDFFVEHLWYSFIIMISCIVAYVLTSHIPDQGILTLGIKFIICILTSNFIYYIAYRNNELFIKSRNMFTKVIYSVK